MQAVLSKLSYGKFMGLGSFIVNRRLQSRRLCCDASGVAAIGRPSSIRRRLSRGSIVSLTFSLQAVRQDAATEERISKHRRYFDMKLTCRRRGLRRKWRAVETDIDREQQVLARCRAPRSMSPRRTKPAGYRC